MAAQGEGLRGVLPRGLYRAPGSAAFGAQGAARPAHGFAAAAAKEKSSMQGFLIDFAAGGTSGAIAKTCTAPIERVKLIIQTQDANPRIKSGEVRARAFAPVPPPPSPPLPPLHLPLVSSGERFYNLLLSPRGGGCERGDSCARGLAAGRSILWKEGD